MIRKDDIKDLIKLQKALLEVRDGQTIDFNSLLSEGVIYFPNIEEDFNELSLILENYGLAEKVDWGGSNKTIIKTDKTHRIHIEDIFEEEQREIRKKDIEHNAIEVDLSSKKWYSPVNLATIISTIIAVFSFLFGLYFSLQNENLNKKIEAQKKIIETKNSEIIIINNQLKKLNQKNKL